MDEETQAPLCEAFLSDETFEAPNARVTHRDLYARFCVWHNANHEGPILGPRLFMRALRDAGMSPRHDRDGLAFSGIQLRDVPMKKEELMDDTALRLATSRAQDRADKLGYTGGIKTVFVEGYLESCRDEQKKSGVGDLSSLFETFLAESTVVDHNAEVLVRVVYAAYLEWWKERYKNPPLGPRKFAEALTLHCGAWKVHKRDGVVFLGLRMKDGDAV